MRSERTGKQRDPSAESEYGVLQSDRSYPPFALNLISQNPNIANNPQAKAMIDVIKSGDAKKGEELARNLCSTYGVDPQEASKQAANFFKMSL